FTCSLSQPIPSFDPYRITTSSTGLDTEAEVQDSHMARKLYVGNLPYETSDQDLQTLFAGAGTVETVNVIRDMATGRARGFAFVEMASDEDAQSAINMFNNH